MKRDDEERVSILEALCWQRDYVRESGAPTAALLLESVIADVAAGDDLARALPTTVRFGDLVGLRVMATVHRLVLDGRGPRVAGWIPTVGGQTPRGSTDRDRFHDAIVDLLCENGAVLEQTLGQTPQTNETGRSALLRAALSRQDPTLPVRLFEIGSSAGLNLRADHLPGQPGLEAGDLPPIVERLGCDLHPVDIDTEEGRTHLGSYIWVDDVARFRRLVHAMEVARRVAATVRREDAASFVARIRPTEGSSTVLWHSAMWIYLPEDSKREIRARLAEAGASAGPRSPLVHISWEWDPQATVEAGFSLVMRRWDGTAAGEPRLLATGRSHGTHVALVQEQPVLKEDPLVTRSG